MEKYLKLLFLSALILLSACSDDSSMEPEDNNPIQQLSRITVENREFSDVWGYVNPANGKEYALMGHLGPDPSGISIFDVSDPTAPVQVAQMNDIAGFDLKVYQNYMYSVTGGSFGIGSITDLTDPANPVVVGTFPSSHNITITANGLLIAESPGLKIYSLANPTSPQLLWQGGVFNEGHDATVMGNILYDFHGRENTNIYDISSPGEPILRGIISDPSIAYNHSGYPVGNGNVLLIADELARTGAADITVWDISDLSNPTRIGEYRDDSAIVHNIYVIGSLAYVSYYSAGFRIFDVSDPANLTLLAEFDTSPDFATQDFNGAFGVYPFAPSGVIYVSDIENGLYLFRYNP